MEMLNDDQNEMVTTVAVLASLEAFFILAVTFNPFERNLLKKKYRCFRVTAKVIYYGSLTLQLLISITMFIYILSLWNSNNISDCFLKLPFLFYLIVIAIDFVVRAIVNIGLIISRLLNKDKEENPVEKKDEDEAYIDIVPSIGSGARRLGSYLELGNDIYSMLFVACLNADYHFYNTKVITEFKDLHDGETD